MIGVSSLCLAAISMQLVVRQLLFERGQKAVKEDRVTSVFSNSEVKEINVDWSISLAKYSNWSKHVSAIHCEVPPRTILLNPPDN